jgi:hypothetical protein
VVSRSLDLEDLDDALEKTLGSEHRDGWRIVRQKMDTLSLVIARPIG